MNNLARTVILFILGVTAIGALSLNLAHRRTRLELEKERRLARGKAYVLTIDTAVESTGTDGLPDKCLLTRGDCVRIDGIEANTKGSRAVTLTYAPTVPPLAEGDRRCAAGTSVVFEEGDVKRLVGSAR